MDNPILSDYGIQPAAGDILSDYGIPAGVNTDQEAPALPSKSLVGSLLDHVKNIAAGGVSGIVSPLQAMPNLADIAPDDPIFQNIMMTPKGQPRPIDKIDPYKMFGTKPAPVTSAAGAEQLLGSFITPWYGAKALKMAKALNPVRLVKDLQASHDAQVAANSALYQDAGKLAKQRGVTNVPLNPSVINNVTKHFPSTPRVKDLINKALTGDYDALHEFQSELGRRGTKWINHGGQAEENAAEELLSARDQINNAIESHFDTTGNSDIADMIRKGRAGWRSLKQDFYEYNPIKNMVHPDLKKVPKNPWSILTEDSVPVKNVLNKHPWVGNDVALHIMRQNVKNNPAMRVLAKLLSIAATGAVGASAARKSWNYVGGSQES